ncbi:MAG: MBL fold metallo-hydrolase [Desulfobacterales bacterium]|nr:MBL fold metallo-hydrolase [Desulfobacterales bacterium]
MHITCWGTRGSIPVSGADTVKYGGDTTCFEVRGIDGTRLIIDAGTGIRSLGKKLIDERATQCHLLFTHTHWDHILGLTAFAPIFSNELHITVPVFPSQLDYLEKTLGALFKAPTFPVPFTRIGQRFTFQPVLVSPLAIGPFTITTIGISHPNQGLGFRITEEDRSFVFLTDNELGMVHDGGETLESYAQFAMGCDLLLHDAEYTPEEYALRKSWGHSSWSDALNLARKAQVKRFGFIHHNAEHSDEQVDAMVQACSKQIAQAGEPLSCFAASPHQPITL